MADKPENFAVRQDDLSKQDRGTIGTFSVDMAAAAIVSLFRLGQTAQTQKSFIAKILSSTIDYGSVQ